MHLEETWNNVINYERTYKRKCNLQDFCDTKMNFENF